MRARTIDAGAMPRLGDEPMDIPPNMFGQKIGALAGRPRQRQAGANRNGPSCRSGNIC
jgi:hypothetical protein